MTARRAIAGIFGEFFPEDAPVIDRLQVIESDPVSWLKGAVTPPTVRQAVATTKSGHPVSAIGDTAIAVDPVAGQGAQNTVIQIAELVKAARAHDGEFSADWLAEEFEKHWERRGQAAVEVTRLFLGDPDYATHLELSFPAAAVDPNVAQALLGLLSDPNPLLGLRTREDVENFITAVAGGEPYDQVLARFAPAGQFSGAAPPATVTV